MPLATLPRRGSISDRCRRRRTFLLPRTPLHTHPPGRPWLPAAWTLLGVGGTSPLRIASSRLTPRPGISGQCPEPLSPGRPRGRARRGLQSAPSLGPRPLRAAPPTRGPREAFASRFPGLRSLSFLCLRSNLLHMQPPSAAREGHREGRGGGPAASRGPGGRAGVRRVEVCSRCVSACAGARSPPSAASGARAGGQRGWKLGSSARR